MKVFTPILLRTSFAIVLWTASISAGEVTPVDIERVLQTVTTTEDSNVAGKSLHELFLHLPEASLWDLARASNKSIALQAYFELHNVWQTGETDADARLAKGHAERFLGFFERCSETKAPEWWQKALRKPSTGGRFRYGRVDLGSQLPSEYLEVPREVKLFTHDGSIVVEKNGVRCSFPMSIIQALADSERYVTRCNAEIRENCCVLAFYDAPGSVELFCSIDGKLQWQATAWAQGVLVLGHTGFWDHDVDIQIAEKEIVIFGSGTGGPYAEGFDKGTGRNTRPSHQIDGQS